MATVIVVTDFSDCSRNALRFTCEKISGSGLGLLLLHIYTLPYTYSVEGLAIASISDSISHAEGRMQEELNWVHTYYPEVNIEGRVAVGGFMDSITDQAEASAAALVVLGLAGGYDDIWQWDTDMLDTLIELPIPVLTVPGHVSDSKIANIAFACNYKNVSRRIPVDTIKGIVRFTGAKLHVVYVKRPEDQDITNEAPLIKEMLEEAGPQYHLLESPNVVDAISGFIEKQHIDCLLVIPRRAGAWESLFSRSHSKELARLNRVPIIALHERDV